MILVANINFLLIRMTKGGVERHLVCLQTKLEEFRRERFGFDRIGTPSDDGTIRSRRSDLFQTFRSLPGSFPAFSRGVDDCRFQTPVKPNAMETCPDPPAASTTPPPEFRCWIAVMNIGFELFGSIAPESEESGRSLAPNLYITTCKRKLAMCSLAYVCQSARRDDTI
jgi:hypothetical protein